MNRLLQIITVLFLLFGCVKNETSKFISTENIRKDTVFYLFNKKENPSLKLSLDVEFPKTFLDVDILKKMQSSICSELLGGDSTCSSFDEFYELYTDKWASDYKGLECDFIKKDTMSDIVVDKKAFNWEVSLKGKLVYFDNNAISYSIENNSILDGSSSIIETIRGVNLSLKNGSVLNLEDLFNDEFEDLLKPSILDKLKAQNKLLNNEDLESIGYFAEEEICVSHNFLIENEGITFIYNPGEIAATMIGNVNVTLPYKELSIALKEESLLKNHK